MAAVQDLAPDVGILQACIALGVVRSSFYRYLRPAVVAPSRPAPPRALSSAERETVLAHLHDEQQTAETRERRDQRIHPVYQKPELLATAPNQLWSWDITKLMGPAKWTYFYLYVILDVFSRYVVGWMVAPRESAELARKLIEDTCRKQQIQPGQLTIHADRGSSMTSKPVAFLLADLGVTKTHSRPYVSDDNPFSESQFRTFKYRPDFPDRFGSIQHSRGHSQIFFPWYNDEHRHSGIGMLTPAMVHYGQAAQVLQNRQLVLEAAYQAHPERFVRSSPKPFSLPKEVWINKPIESHESKSSATLQTATA